VTEEFLALDLAGYGALIIAEKGRQLLKGEIAFRHRPLEPKGRKRGREAKPLPTNSVDAELLVALKSLRMKLARERRVPAFAIFPDRTLNEMAERKPRNEEEFAALNGVGAAKLREFGSIFLGAIAAHRPREAAE
jgi:ATP-dependent DNA helicase RecQ